MPAKHTERRLDHGEKVTVTHRQLARSPPPPASPQPWPPMPAQPRSLMKSEPAAWACLFALMLTGTITLHCWAFLFFWLARHYHRRTSGVSSPEGVVYVVTVQVAFALLDTSLLIQLADASTVRCIASCSSRPEHGGELHQQERIVACGALYASREAHYTLVHAACVLAADPPRAALWRRRAYATSAFRCVDQSRVYLSVRALLEAGRRHARVRWQGAS